MGYGSGTSKWASRSSKARLVPCFALSFSWFAFKLDQPGVTIRPLREMTGDDIFNEIFIDEAVVDDADLIGGEGNGWMVTQTTLHFERTGIGAGTPSGARPRPGRAAARPSAASPSSPRPGW